MRRIHAMGRGLAWLALAGLAVACGGSEPAPDAGGAASAPEAVAPEATATTGGPPVIESVEIEPDPPMPGNEVRALVQASDPDGQPIRYEYRWRVAGKPMTGTGDRLVLPDLAKDDAVEVTVVARAGDEESEARSARVNVGNQAPVLFSVTVETPKVPAVGARLVATPRATDPDGDEIEYRYRWLVNDEEASTEGASFDTSGLRRGDRVVVAATAFDDSGRESREALSDPVEIVNAPPRIVSSPTWSREGDVFSYQVEAEDSDGDHTLRYRLKTAPPGMTIDNLSGLVRWQPQADQAGRHTVEVEVDDLHGGQGVQRFEVVMNVEETQPATPPASPAPAPADQDEEASD